jgi:replication-associated recombination protein RarA
MKKMANLFTMGRTRHQIANKIKDLKSQVKDLASRRDRYRIEDIVVNPTATSTATTSVDPRLLALYKDQKELVGIKEASAVLINKLIDGNNNVSMQHLKILSIFGFGGLGKTTLAKAVYDGIHEQFESMAFVSVGRNPDLKKLVKNILFELDKQKYVSFSEAMLDEKQLVDELRGLLQNKRYVLLSTILFMFYLTHHRI